MKHKSRARQVALSGILVSLMLILGWVESLIPLNIGVPGIKLGLSNGVLIFAVYMLDFPTAYCLMALKILLSGFMFSGVSAMLFAFAGGMLSLTGMCLLSRIPRMPSLIVSMVGGMLHNIGQVALAMVILDTNKLVWYMIALIPIGIACGLLTGLSARVVMDHLRKIGMIGNPETRNTRWSWLLAMLMIIILACCAFAANRSLFASTQNKPAVDWGADETLDTALPNTPIVISK